MVGHALRTQFVARMDCWDALFEESESARTATRTAAVKCLASLFQERPARVRHAVASCQYARRSQPRPRRTRPLGSRPLTGPLAPRRTAQRGRTPLRSERGSSCCSRPPSRGGARLSTARCAARPEFEPRRGKQKSDARVAICCRFPHASSYLTNARAPAADL